MRWLLTCEQLMLMQEGVCDDFLYNAWFCFVACCVNLNLKCEFCLMWIWNVCRFGKEVCDAIVAKCLTGRPKTVEKAQASFMLWIELEAVDAFLVLFSWMWSYWVWNIQFNRVQLIVDVQKVGNCWQVCSGSMENFLYIFCYRVG